MATDGRPHIAHAEKAQDRPLATHCLMDKEILDVEGADLSW